MSDDEPTVLMEFDDGTVVERHNKQRTGGIQNRFGSGELTVYRVKTPSGRNFEFGEMWEGKRIAIQWGAIWSRTGGTRFVVDKDLIPSKVALLGKPAIATYLSAVQGYSHYEIADLMDITGKTVAQYHRTQSPMSIFLLIYSAPCFRPEYV